MSSESSQETGHEDVEVIPEDFCKRKIRVTKIGRRLEDVVEDVTDGNSIEGYLAQNMPTFRVNTRTDVYFGDGKERDYWRIHTERIVRVGDVYHVYTPRSVYRIERIEAKAEEGSGSPTEPTQASTRFSLGSILGRLFRRKA